MQLLKKKKAFCTFYFAIKKTQCQQSTGGAHDTFSVGNNKATSEIKSMLLASGFNQRGQTKTRCWNESSPRSRWSIITNPEPPARHFSILTRVTKSDFQPVEFNKTSIPFRPVTFWSFFHFKIHHLRIKITSYVQTCSIDERKPSRRVRRILGPHFDRRHASFPKSASSRRHSNMLHGVVVVGQRI